MKITDLAPTKQVLGIVQGKIALGAIVGNTGVEADPTGRKLIPAGTPVGGDNDILADEQAELVVSNDAKAQGVLEHTVDVTEGPANATLIIAGYINENRLPEDVKITPEAKTALAGKVVFFKRNL